MGGLEVVLGAHPIGAGDELRAQHQGAHHVGRRSRPLLGKETINGLDGADFVSLPRQRMGEMNQVQGAVGFKSSEGGEGLGADLEFLGLEGGGGEMGDGADVGCGQPRQITHATLGQAAEQGESFFEVHQHIVGSCGRNWRAPRTTKQPKSGNSDQHVSEAVADAFAAAGHHAVVVSERIDSDDEIACGDQADPQVLVKGSPAHSDAGPSENIFGVGHGSHVGASPQARVDDGDGDGHDARQIPTQADVDGEVDDVVAAGFAAAVEAQLVGDGGTGRAGGLSHPTRGFAALRWGRWCTADPSQSEETQSDDGSSGVCVGGGRFHGAQTTTVKDAAQDHAQLQPPKCRRGRRGGPSSGVGAARETSGSPPTASSSTMAQPNNRPRGDTPVTRRRRSVPRLVGMYVTACFLVFVLGYSLTIVLTSIGYHRALAHGSVRLEPWVRKALIELGPWFTGFDAKTWVVMHRMHHQHSDTPQDPHSPLNVGLLGMFQAQYRGFVQTQQGLLLGDPHYASIGKDLQLSWVARRAWFAPYVAQISLGVVVGLVWGWWLGIALVLGLMSHVVQGAIINYFGHAHGGRNFDLGDNSRNNHLAAWLVLGEGFQNNHHRYPSSARFSHRRFEVDLGYGVCRTLAALGVLKIVSTTLMPRDARTNI